MYPFYVTFCKHKVPPKPLPLGLKVHAPNLPVNAHPAVRGANVNVFAMFGTRTLFVDSLFAPTRHATQRVNKEDG